MFAALGVDGDDGDRLWLAVRAEAERDAAAEPLLAPFLQATVLERNSLEDCLAHHLGSKLRTASLLPGAIAAVALSVYAADPSLGVSLRRDAVAVADRDPACTSFLYAALFYKGFLALQCHRVAHALWTSGRRPLALALQSRASAVWAVDAHPAARVGSGVMLDHATGIVIGETAAVGDDCSLAHHATLGGTGVAGGDRHPTLGDGVLVGASATLLGPIEVGDGAKIGAGSVVLTDVPPNAVFVGVPARQLGLALPASQPAGATMQQTLDDAELETAWSDFRI